MIGRTIGRYRVVEQLGQGGMGVVYKARDTVLDRFVAIKLLPPDRSSDPDRRQRFLQEAKAASALNHPGIVTVHDVLLVDGQDVLVMELVDGDTLDDLMTRRRLPVAQALGLGVAVADALARAHAAGIVHRDLKPSNVMVTSEGVKVMDFGLAKMAAAPFPDPEAPTMGPGEHALTRERVILGTIPWMSPEQASGDPVDARSDIFSFGVLLYEMLTGHHPFRRASTSETLEAIRSAEVDPPTHHAPGLPPEVDRAVMRCLRRDPTRRWQSLSDLAAVLSDLKEDSESRRRSVTRAAAADRPGPSRRWLWGALVAAVAVAAGAALLLLMLRTPRDNPPLDLRRLTFDGGFSGTPALSPDGQLVAYASDRSGDGQLDIWVRHITRPEPARLTDEPVDEWMPRFSPDGSQVVFQSARDGGGIYVVNTLGGEPRRLASGGMFPRFSPDGTRVLYMECRESPRSDLCPLFTVSTEGGAPQAFAAGYGSLPPPHGNGGLWSPDGSRVLFAGAPLADPRGRDWLVAPTDGGETVSSGALESLPRMDIVQLPCAWWRDRILFMAGTTIEGVNLYSASISPEGRIDGPARTLTTGPGMMWTPSVSDDGRVALSKFHWVIHLWQAEIDPDTGLPVGDPERLTADAAPKFSFSLARDDSLLAYSAYSGPRGARRAEVLLRPLAEGRERLLFSSEARTLSLEPRLSPDGSLIAWLDRVDDQPASFVAPVADPVGRELCRSCMVEGFFSDGSEVLLRQLPNRYVRHRLADGLESPVLDSGDLRILDVDLSWDDRWLVVTAARPDGTITIDAAPIVEPPPPPSQWIGIDGGSHWVGSPRWSPDGRRVYFLSNRDDFTCVWARPVDVVTKLPTGGAFPILHAHRDTMKMVGPGKGGFRIAVGSRHLVFNAAEMTGDVYLADLPPS